MSKWFLAFFTFINTLLFSCVSAACCQGSCQQSVDVSLGWRRDTLKWDMDGLDASCIPGCVDSRILFKDVDSYTISGKAKWVDTFYYIRLSGEYGLTDKGRARERFRIDSPLLYFPIDVHTSDPVKRRSEVYDFNIAAGYPFTVNICCSRLKVVPLIGFSFHRQHLRVKQDRESSICCCCCEPSSSCCCSCGESSSSRDCCCCDSSSDSWSFSPCSSSCYCCPSSYSEYCWPCYSSSHFFLSSCNPFVCSPSTDPFASPSPDPTIASALGLRTCRRTSNYRFTWYGFYIGTDLEYALDPCWTLFSELELHFLDHAHRKRKSWTGVYFVDDYHRKSMSYGFNGVIGLTYEFCSCWYSVISVDFRWWKSTSSSDEVTWRMAGVKAGLGYSF